MCGGEDGLVATACNRHPAEKHWALSMGAGRYGRLCTSGIPEKAASADAQKKEFVWRLTEGFYFFDGDFFRPRPDFGLAAACG